MCGIPDLCCIICYLCRFYVFKIVELVGYVIVNSIKYRIDERLKKMGDNLRQSRYGINTNLTLYKIDEIRSILLYIHDPKLFCKVCIKCSQSNKKDIIAYISLSERVLFFSKTVRTSIFFRDVDQKTPSSHSSRNYSTELLLEKLHDQKEQI